MGNNVLGEIKAFLDRGSSTSLEIVFGLLEIKTMVKGELLKTMVKQNGRLRIRKSKNDNRAQMEVLDNLVFNFDFSFPYPKSYEYYKSNDLELPRPLTLGSLIIDKEFIELEFTIDTLDSKIKVAVKHRYNELQLINQ
ncbi:hypothetical protein [Flagellimonas beolgyonensis]|uniref:hypothetical protein n=1 Tax=Flagellimonas beolgyonensis TaxID=864064 RepID=UPI000F8F2B7D|nr:hypothetical protein [Allomuricauda beolgyonensis]